MGSDGWGGAFPGCTEKAGSRKKPPEGEIVPAPSTQLNDCLAFSDCLCVSGFQKDNETHNQTLLTVYTYACTRPTQTQRIRHTYTHIFVVSPTKDRNVLEDKFISFHFT